MLFYIYLIMSQFCMSPQLSCGDMCKIIAWSGMYFWDKSDFFFARFGSWACKFLVRWSPGLRVVCTGLPRDDTRLAGSELRHWPRSLGNRQQIFQPWKTWLSVPWGCAKKTEFQYIGTWMIKCCYNLVNFLQNPHKSHPITHPLGRDMRCFLCMKTVIYTLSLSLQQHS